MDELAARRSTPPASDIDLTINVVIVDSEGNETPYRPELLAA